MSGKGEQKNVTVSTSAGTVMVDVDSLLGKRANSLADPAAPLPVEAYSADAEKTIASLTQKPFDKYEYRKSLGRGGMKVVIQVRDRDTMRDIAMAILPDAQNRPKADTLRFIEEARIAAGLEHPNIVPIHDIGVDRSGSPYFTMKLLRGETFAEVLHRIEAGDQEYAKKYTLERRLRIFLKICNGVAFAHSKGVLHLDLKPANVQIGDFGEVQIMDWGLARILGVGAEAGRPAGAAAGPGVAADGITKGTPGYMAPEQAAGMNSMTDCRTDVYALGGILYTILTLKNSLASGNELPDQIKDTLAGKIIPPRRRTPEREIPPAIEAVAMKAMSLHPEDRYASVRELRDEVYAFLDGYATQAEDATFFRKSILFIRRNLMKVVASILLFSLIGGIGFFAVQEYRYRKSGWFPSITEDFTDPGGASDTWECRSTSILTELAPWPKTGDGLQMRQGEWIWFRDDRLKNDLRVELKFIPSASSSLLLAVNSRPELLRYTWFWPCGYLFRFSASSGNCMLSRNIKADVPEAVAAAEASFRIGVTNSLVLERNGGLLTVTLNGTTIIETTDLFPLRTGAGQVGIFAVSGETSLQEIRAFSLALPVKSSPLIAGDTLMENGHFTEAVEKYISIAEAYAASNRDIMEEALVKAYFITVSKLEPGKDREKYVVNIRKKILSSFSHSKYMSKILELDAIQSWTDGKYTRALELAEELYRQNPGTEIIRKLLQLPHHPLKSADRDRLIRNAARARDLKHLNLSRLGLTSLEGLSGCRLLSLDCSGNDLKNLKGLEGIPLEYLDCSHNRITSLKPLSGTALKELSCYCNRITSLEGLDVRNLNQLLAARNRIRDLDGLKTASVLSILDIRDNAVTSLEPLRPLNLNSLVAGENPIRSVDPLKRMELQELYIDDTEIADISPLKECPLTVLSLFKCRNVRDVSPLLAITTLQRLSLPPNAENMELLQQMPSLLFVTTSEVTPSSHDNAKPENFWKKEAEK